MKPDFEKAAREYNMFYCLNNETSYWMGIEIKSPEDHFLAGCEHAYSLPKWISVKDQIPPDYQRVMFFDSRDNSIHVGYFVWGQTPVNHVTHWQPLPENPKE